MNGLSHSTRNDSAAALALARRGLAPALLAIVGPLLATAAAGAESRVSIRCDKERNQIAFVVDGQEAIVYQHAPDLDLPHFYPLRSPSGRALTVERTDPYPHHRSFWFADTVELAGQRRASFYNALYSAAEGLPGGAKFRDRVRHVDYVPGKVEEDRASASLRLVWEMDGKAPVLDELRALTVVALGDGEYLLDVEFTLTASYGDVRFVSDAVHYAWPYLRMAREWSVEQGGVITSSSGGKNQAGTDGRTAEWIDYSNRLAGQTEGLALLSHPQNARPHRWLSRDYGTFGPRRADDRSGRPFIVRKGESISQRVGVLVHRGDAATGRVAERFAQYAAGPAKSAACPAEPKFRFAAVDATSLGLWEQDRPVCVYNHGTRQHPAAPADRWRSSYVHPLYGLDGEVLTDDFPRDHYHHRGLFWAWPHVVVDGREYDLWTLHGVRQQFERWQEQAVAAERAVLAVENGWYLGDRRIVKEEVRLVVAAANGERREIDLQLKLTATDRPVTLRGAEGKGYGGLSLRFAPRTQTVVTTPDGRQTEDLNLKRLAWADLSARFAGRAEASGVAIFTLGGPAATGPQWITRDYGFLGVGWPGEAAVTLQPAEPVTLTYRLVVHRQVAEIAKLKPAAEPARRDPAPR